MGLLRRIMITKCLPNTSDDNTNRSIRSQPFIAPAKTSPEAAMYTSHIPLFDTVRTDGNADVPIPACNVGLNNETEPWPGSMAAGVNNDLNVENENLSTVSHRTND